jgi:hypothetical protein
MPCLNIEPRLLCSLQGEFVPLAPQLAALPNATYNTTTVAALTKATCHE